MTDLMERLTAARPTEDDLEGLWPDAQRSATLTAVRRVARRRRTRRRAVGLAAAAVTGALVLLPVVLDPGEAAAQDLRALAAVAAAADGPTLTQGTWLHVRTESVQRNAWFYQGGEVWDTDREAWIRWDGHQLAIDRRESVGWTEYQVFPRHREEASFGSPTPEFAASLPDDAEALRTFLDAHVSGSNSHEEALFVAVTDLARSGFLPPATLAAALEVLADVDGVRTEEVVVDGRTAVEVKFVRFWFEQVAVHSVTIDTATARVLSERDADPLSTYESVTTSSEVVTAVPPEVLAAFEEHGAGERVYDPGVTPLDP